MRDSADKCWGRIMATHPTDVLTVSGRHSAGVNGNNGALDVQLGGELLDGNTLDAFVGRNSPNQTN